MKTSKRWIGTAVLLSMLLAGCGSQKEQDKVTETVQAEETVSEASKETDAEEKSEEEAVFSGEEALQYANAYTDFGIKRTGTESQLEAAQWMAEELEKSGFTVQMDEIPFRQFELDQCSVSVGETSMEAFPYWFPLTTGDEGVAGSMALYSETGKMDGSVVVYEVPEMAAVSDISEIAQECRERGAKAVIAIVEHTTGLVSAQNAVDTYEQKELPLPCVIAPSEKREYLLEEAKKGTEAKVLLTGSVKEDAKTANVAAVSDHGSDRWVIVTTPISGWFTCHAERGGGVGLFLEMAKYIPALSSDYNYLFLGTTGHELDFMGAEAYEEKLPSPEDTLIWLHLGSGIGAKEAISEGYQFVGSSPYLTETVRSFFEGDEITVQASQGKLLQSELGKIINDGYPTFGFFGANLYFHTAQDKADGIDASKLQKIGEDSLELLRKIMETDGLTPTVTVERLSDGPLIYPEMDESLPENIQGPAVIRVPEWVEDPLGTYYMYFADHKGDRIKLAYADDLKGPWKIYSDGAIKLSQTTFLQEPPVLTPEQEAALPQMAKKLGLDPESKVAHDLTQEATCPHIASPEAVVDEENKRILLYFHGLSDVAVQTTRVAASEDGIHFEKDSGEDLSTSYLKLFKHDGYVYGMSMPGQLYRSKDGITGFEKGPKLFHPNMRHHALYLDGDMLYIFFTQVGDAPEVIYVSAVDISGDWTQWVPSAPIEIMRPEFDWEGADAPIEPSIRSTAYGHVNQLRDPYIFKDGDQLYMFYALAGESGIGGAKITIDN